MNARSFQCRLRPLVDDVWMLHCHAVAADHNNKSAKETWYRSSVSGCIGRPTSRDASEADQRALIAGFQAIRDALAPSPPAIANWTPRQNASFATLSAEAWRRSAPSSKSFEVWLADIVVAHGVMAWKAPDKIKSFDGVMGDLAVIARNLYWISRTAAAPEIRVRHCIAQCLAELSAITGSPRDWSYVRSIWDQAELLPSDIEDAPARMLIQVLQMLDTHRRRLLRS